jgi:hypothetical protein
MNEETIILPPIILRWSAWTPWADLLVDSRSGAGIMIPNGVPGVYEVRYAGADEWLHIGRASDLRMRIRQGLVKGKVPHSTGERIRAQEDTARLVVRWAVTDRPAATEEELHKRHQAKFGKLPTYTLRT